MESESEPTGKIIDTIRRAFHGDASETGDVEKRTVLEWMKSPDLEVRGALYSKIRDVELAKRIKPGLQISDYFDFVIPYLEQCLEQNPEGEWSHSRYLAGHELVAWIVDFWDKGAAPRGRFEEIKRRLADLYRRGDADVRYGLLNGVLEHLFENRQLAAFFKDWERAPLLSIAYRDALLWTTNKPGGA